LAELVAHQTTFQSQDIRLFGISVDSPKESKQLKQELKLNFELLSDHDRSIITSWGILNKSERNGIAYPNVYLIDSDMKIVYHSKDKLRSRAAPEPLLKFIQDHSANSESRLINQNHKDMRPLIIEYLLVFPKKWGWI